MVIAAAGENAKILVPRNAHKSVMAGLIISGAEPVYMPVEYLDNWGITAHLRPETAAGLLKENPDCRAIFAVSPTYHGICSDIGRLSALAHDASIPLLVDEAHGAHIYFSDNLPAGAISSGADVCSQSLHKTAGALTQASLLHLKSGLIDQMRLDSALRMTMSTSPSYILLTSLETARADLEKNGNTNWNDTISLAEEIRAGINGTGFFRCPGAGDFRAEGVPDYDSTRIILNCDRTEITGRKLKERLWEEYGIDTEMADDRNVLLLLTPGNDAGDGQRLISALKKIAASAPMSGKSGRKNSNVPPVPKMALTPRQAYFAAARSVPWAEMRGKIAAEPAAPYPPGIPAIYPGELVTDEIFEYLSAAKAEGLHMHGPGDRSLSTFRICDI